MSKVLRDVDEPLPPIELPTVVAHPTTGVLAGRTIVFLLPPTRMWIAQRRGELGNLELAEYALNAVVSHDLGVELDVLPAEVVVDLVDEWMKATREDAVPPARGSS